MLPELEELNRIRLDEDKTFGQLAAEVGLSDQSTLHRILSGAHQPMERTLHKIRRYLTARTATPKPKPRRRRVS